MNISHELVFSRYKKGITLSPPSPFTLNASIRVEHILQQPSCIYFVKADDYSLVKINSTCAQSCQFDSESSAIGKVASDFLNKESAHFAVTTDKAAMSQETVNIIEHKLEHSDGTINQYLTIKSPWYQDHNLAGIFGCSIALGQHPLAKSLQCIIGLGLLGTNAFNIMPSTNTLSLSKQELRVAKLLITGLTAKEIAKHINLSYRTVESYLMNIKTKFQCKNKTELAIKLVDILRE